MNRFVLGTEPAIWGVELEKPELVTSVEVTNREHDNNYSKKYTPDISRSLFPQKLTEYT